MCLIILCRRPWCCDRMPPLLRLGQNIKGNEVTLGLIDFGSQRTFEIVYVGWISYTSLPTT